MSNIDRINVILEDLHKELAKLEKAEPSKENLERVRWIEKRAKELKVARTHLYKQSGMRETA